MTWQDWLPLTTSAKHTRDHGEEVKVLKRYISSVAQNVLIKLSGAWYSVTNHLSLSIRLFLRCLTTTFKLHRLLTSNARMNLNYEI
jgi:hypothetical protein